MKTLITCLFMLFIANLVAEVEVPYYESGSAVFKIREEYKPELLLTAGSTGIRDVDDLLGRLGIQSIRPRWKTNPKLHSKTDLSLILEVKLSAGQEPIGICNALSRLMQVAYAEPVYIDQVMDAPDDYYYPFMRYFDALQAEEAWSIHKGENGSAEIVIAVTDTGVNWKHPDLGENIYNNLGEDANANGFTIYHTGSVWAYDPGDLDGIDTDENGKIDDLIGWDFMHDLAGNEYYDPYDDGGHGTNVSGIANARTNNSGIGVASVAWNVKTMPISCSPDEVSIYRGYDAIIYAAENGADVINCSWGGIYFSQANQEAINYAWSLGPVIVAASGNGNNMVPLYPASYEKVVAVGLVNNAGVHSVATYGPFLDVCSPMDSLYTTMENAYGYRGFFTSYACPVASSLTALIRSHHPEWTNAEVAQQLMACCQNIDAANPVAKSGLLGYGRLNASNAMSETLLTPPPGLKLSIQDKGIPTETNGNKAVEPGEQFSLNFVLRNFAPLTSSGSVHITLSCYDLNVSILNNSYTCSIGADTTLDVTNAFLVQVHPTARIRFVSFTMTFTADVPILAGNALRYDMLINGPGIYVWEGYPNTGNNSGTYIRNYLNTLGYTTVLSSNYTSNTNNYPASFVGVDAVFLSFGIAGGRIYSLYNNLMFDALRQYLEAGGKIYIEGGDVIASDIQEYFPEVEPGLDGDDILYPLLGIAAAEDGTTNSISLLSGATGWLTLGLTFSGSTQSTFQSTDKYTPNANGIAAWQEDNYGIVGIQSMGSHAQRVFVTSYALRELIDGTAPNTKTTLLSRILDFFFSLDLRLPPVQNLSIEQTSTDSLKLIWEYPFDVDSFRIYSGDNPDNIIYEEIPSYDNEVWIAEQPRRFFYIKAERNFGL